MGTIMKQFGGGEGTASYARTLRTKVFQEQGLDLKLLDKISKEYMLSPKSFRDINKVETKLAFLGEQYAQAVDKSAKASIKEVIDKYELQQKKLLKDGAEVEAEKKRKNPPQTNNNNLKSPQTYEMNENEELVPVPNENENTPKESNKRNESKESDEVQVVPGFSTPQRKTGNVRRAIVSDKPKTPNTMNDSTKRKNGV